MHVLIINGSPRVRLCSNTDKILEKFTKGMRENGTTYERYEVSDRSQWKVIREAFNKNRHILMALPLYVEGVPGLFLEFLETLTPKKDGSRLSFILQSGFAEGIQLRCGEAYLEKLAGMLGCEYGGTLVKGDNFSIRMNQGESRERITGPYMEMGREYGKNLNFFSEKCKRFTGYEVFPAPLRFVLGILFKTLAKRSFDKTAASWGCTRPLDDRPYQ